MLHIATACIFSAYYVADSSHNDSCWNQVASRTYNNNNNNNATAATTTTHTAADNNRRKTIISIFHAHFSTLSEITYKLTNIFHCAPFPPSPHTPLVAAAEDILVLYIVYLSTVRHLSYTLSLSWRPHCALNDDAPRQSSVSQLFSQSVN